MNRFYGACHDLERLIKVHLFIICPNNSGSTFLQNALATSKKTWNLEKEGQHTFGFAGPSTRQTGTHLIWASKQSWLDLFTCPESYNWSITRRAWYFQAFTHNACAGIFVTKSPPFLLSVAQLQQHFPNARFIFMVRNPYAALEGIFRRYIEAEFLAPDKIITAAARHIMRCFEYQQQNIKTYSDCGTFFTYEQMCDTPTLVEKQIQALVPELDDLVICQRVPVKGMYNEMLRNMNDQQISRLSTDNLDQINRIFKQFQKLMKYFDYQLIT